MKAVGPRFVYPLSLQLADRLTAPRVALVGDAGHSVHPIAGQGLNMGLKDVAALAEVLIEAVRLASPLRQERQADDTPVEHFAFSARLKRAPR